jgi:hypothetical protein
MEYKGFSGWFSRKVSWGLGFDFGFARDHVYATIRILNREACIQWEAGF